MAKITISRIFESSKFLTTKAGQELQELIVFLSDFAEQSIRSLRNGLTFADNFDCQIKTVILSHGVAQQISTTKKPIGMIPIRVVSKTPTSVAGLDGFQWYFNDDGSVSVNAFFTGATIIPLDVTLVILFG